MTAETHELGTDDLQAMLDYLDGRLDQDAMMDLELRLSEDVRFGQAFEELADRDGLLRAAAALGRAPPRPRVLGAPLTGLLSLAAGLLVAALGFWSTKGAPPLDLRVGLLGSAGSLPGANVQLGLDPSFVPPGYGYRGEGDDGSPVSADAYWEEAAPAQRARHSAALDGASPPPPVTAGHFVVPFEASRECSVVVLAVGDRGFGSGLLFPTADDWAAAPRLAADELHVLPRPPLQRDGERVSWEAGFLVPLDVDDLTVLVGARESPFTTDLATSIRTILERTHAMSRAVASDTLAAELRSRGFSVRRFTVNEPAP